MKKNEKKTLTTGFGKPVDNDLNSVTAGAKGPVLMQDVHLIEKLAHFDRERIPERVVHAKGAGAHGYFEVTATSASTPGPSSSPRWARRPTCSCASRPSAARRARPTPSATRAASRSSSTPRKATTT